MRNQNSHFALNPHANIKRSRFDRSYTHKTTFNAGKLVPIMCEEILPGDTVTLDTSILSRMQTLITPLMDDMYLDTYFFFVPNRLLWKNWQRFCGESDEPWYDDTVYSVPQLTFNAATQESINSIRPGSVADYLGLPIFSGEAQALGMTSVSHLPFRAYCRVWNDWFRNENTQGLTTFNTEDEGVEVNSRTSDAWYGGDLLPVNKYRDYFTSALPEPQKGPDVTIGVGNTAPVFTSPTDHSIDVLRQGGDSAPNLHWYNSGSGAVDVGQMYNVAGRGTAGSEYNYMTTFGQKSDSGSVHATLAPSNLIADISAATSISINELRMAFATQQFYEQSARSGSRYIEILESMFGVNSPDSRLQRSEYLGGNRVAINVSQVVQNSETNSTPLGYTGAYSLTTDHQNSFTKSFVEHGYLLGVCCVRYPHSYQNGIDKMWLRKDKFDFYWPIFSNIGEQPILNKQIYADGSSADNEVFGYQEAWAEYRYGINRVSGEFRSAYYQTLDYWHLADDYTSLPSLSDEWSQENGDVIDRALAVSGRVSDQFMADFYFNMIATRPMPVYSVPGLTRL